MEVMNFSIRIFTLVADKNKREDFEKIMIERFKTNFDHGKKS